MQFNRRQKKVINKLGFHLLVKYKVEERKKLQDGSEQTVEKEKFVRVGGLYPHRDAAQADGVAANRPYRIVGVRVDATPVSTHREKGNTGEVAVVKE